ncbi:TolC family protein [Helicobacter sp.]|uniref:TolC family protein n=1 Tax=Helicobacter sp. TaxID=218 RepID=UPI0025B92709|nr:TolC family protein [Helicobacter sp.]MBR2495041.1 TolC family protein [Helicobacter sp.]
MRCMRYGIALLLCAYAYGLSFQEPPRPVPVLESSASTTPSGKLTDEPALGVNELLKQIDDLTKDSTQKVGLKDLLNGADSNYSLQAQMLQAQSNKKVASVAKAAFLPRFDIDYDYQHNYKTINNMMQFGNFGNYQTQAANARFSLDLFSGFSTINMIREKNATYRSSVADVEYTKQSIYLQVIQQYYSYFNNLSQLLSLKRQLDQVRADLVRIQKLYESGLSTIDDLESLRSQVSSSEYQIADMRLSVEQNILMLKYLTNIDFDGLKREDLATPALKDNLERQDIISLKEQINALKYQNKQQHYYPTITLSDTYTWQIQKPEYVANPTKFGSDPATAPFYQRLFPTHANVIGLSVTLKVFDDIGVSFQKQVLRLSQLAQEKQLAYKQAEKTKDEMLYRKTLEVARSKILSAEASLKSANISFDNVRKKYNNQLVNFTDYLRALSTKYNAEATYNQALNNYELQKANYIFYSGQQIQEYIK